MRSICIGLLLFFGLLMNVPTVSGEQYYSNGQVVHTRVAPVVAHRVLPPFRGVHVYQGRSSRR